MNLAIPFIAAAEPMPCPVKTIALPATSTLPQATRSSDGALTWSFTLWDVVDVSGPELTLQGLIDVLERELGAVASMIVCGNHILYSSFSFTAAQTKRLQTRLADLVPVAPDVVFLTFEATCEDEDGNDLDIPTIRYRRVPCSH